MENQQKSFQKLVCKTWRALVSHECKFQYVQPIYIYIYNIYNLLCILDMVMFWPWTRFDLRANQWMSACQSLSISLWFMARVWKCFGLIINSNGLQNCRAGNLWHIISGHKKVVVIRKSRLCYTNCTWILCTAKKYRKIGWSLNVSVDFVAIGSICSSIYYIEYRRAYVSVCHDLFFPIKCHR